MFACFFNVKVMCNYPKCVYKKRNRSVGIRINGANRADAWQLCGLAYWMGRIRVLKRRKIHVSRKVKYAVEIRGCPLDSTMHYTLYFYGDA